MQLLADSDRRAELDPKLTALTTSLLPADVLRDLISGKFALATVSTDGPSALLPCQALIVKAAKEPKYLLDFGPPIVYAASATLLLKLVERNEKPTGKSRAPLPTVADPNYEAPTSAAAGFDTATSARLSPRR